jgi:chorismate mutase/prephenate dehydrogenase
MKKDIPEKEKIHEIGKELPKSAVESLGNLRRNIDSIDQEILEILVKRQSQVEQMVSLKKAYNLPVYHPAREEDMISDRRRQAKEAGLNPDYFEELFRTILRRSRVDQTDSMAGKGIRSGSDVLLVGGTRGMGRYFHHWFSKSEYKVRSMGSRDWHKVDTLCDGIDLAVISVPIEVTIPVIHKIAPHLPPDCLLTDLTSIKGPPLKAMLESHSGPVIGLHPLFGPTTSTMDKQIVVVTPGRDPEACQWLYDQFVTWGALLVEADAEEHDEIMAIVQSLRHFATFSFGQFLHRLEVDLARTLEFSSPIYRLELGMVGRLFAQDPSLYAEIIFASPERRALLKDYLASMGDNLMMIEKGDKEAFKEQFHRIAEWFGPFSGQAMRESSFLIDKLIERF